MNKFLIPVLFLAIINIAACKNKEKESNEKPEITKTLTDSLEEEVMDGHNVGMAKYGKLTAMQNEANRLLDSINSLPEKARKTSESLKSKLNELIGELSYARSGMDKWMEEYNIDSAINNTELRIKYLSDEKIKVTKVKESILNSLQKADTLLKAKH